MTLIDWDRKRHRKPAEEPAPATTKEAETAPKKEPKPAKKSKPQVEEEQKT